MEVATLKIKPWAWVTARGKAKVGPEDTVAPTPNEFDYGQAIETVIARWTDQDGVNIQERSQHIEDEAFRVMHRRLARVAAIDSILESLSGDSTVQDLCDEISAKCGDSPAFNQVVHSPVPRDERPATAETIKDSQIAMWKERAEGNKTAMLVCVRERDEAREELERFTTNVLGQTHMPVAIHTKLMEEQVRLYQASNDHVAAELNAMTIDRDLFKAARTKLLVEVKGLKSMLSPAKLTGELRDGVKYTEVKVNRKTADDGGHELLRICDSDGDPVRGWGIVEHVFPLGTKVRVGGVFCAAVTGEVSGYHGRSELMITPDAALAGPCEPERWSAFSVEGVAR